MTKLRALFFDFDGLILDTEAACYASWQALFREHGHEYALADFQRIVGTSDGAHDPRLILDGLVGRRLDWTALDTRRRGIEDAFGASLVVKPGVRPLLEAARAAGIALAVVSSSPHAWVGGHLARHGLAADLPLRVCAEDAPRGKPAPDLYLEALRRTGVPATATLALEDSHNGSLAAKRAGLWCAAVPHAITASQDFSHCDLRLETLAGATLADLEARLAAAA